MSVDLNHLTAHLAPQQQEDVKKAYHRQAEHSTAAFLYCFFLGIFGAHRFYLGQWGKGLAHLILPVLAAAAIVAGIALNWDPAIIALIVIPLLVIALVWEIVNLFTIDAEVYRHNLKLAEQLVAQSLLADTTVEQRGEAKLESMLAANQAASAAATDQARASSERAAEAAALAAAAAAPASIEGEAAPAAAAEEVATSAVNDAAAALSVGQYTETSVTQISDDAGARQSDASAAQAQAQAQAPELTSWSESESVRDSETTVASDAAEAQEVTAAAGAHDTQGIVEEHAAVEEQAAAAENVSYWDAVTRAHEGTGYTVTDSVERTATYGIGEAQDTPEEAIAEAEPLPSAAEAAAATWPDHLLTDVTDEGTLPPTAPSAPFEGFAAAAAAPELARAPTPPPAPAQVRDVTDMGFAAGEAKPLADVTTEGGVPLSVALPGGADELVGLAEIVATQPEAPAAAAATEESLLVLVPAEDEPVSAGPGDDAASVAGDTVAAAESATSEPAAGTGGYEEPSTAPYLAGAGAAAAAAGAMTGYAALSSDTPTLVPEPADQPERQPDYAAQPEGETLAELAGYSVGAVPEHTEPPAQATESPVQAAPEAEYHSTHAAEGGTEHHQMRRIRVVRQVKVDGQVVEETAAEEFIEADADPEPVRQRLQEMLRQQAAGRQQPSAGGAEA